MAIYLGWGSTEWLGGFLNGVQWEKRLKGHPRNTWRNEVLKDIRVLGLKNWTKVMMDRVAWYDLVEKMKTDRGLYDKRITTMLTVS
jgi:hypothetical protein